MKCSTISFGLWLIQLRRILSCYLNGDDTDEVITTEILMAHALSRGILIANFNALSVGMIWDYIARYDVIHSRKEEEHVSVAGQKEFDTF